MKNFHRMGTTLHLLPADNDNQTEQSEMYKWCMWFISQGASVAGVCRQCNVWLFITCRESVARPRPRVWSIATTCCYCSSQATGPTAVHHSPLTPATGNMIMNGVGGLGWADSSERQKNRVLTWMEEKHNLEFIMPRYTACTKNLESQKWSKIDENRQKTEENGPKQADVGKKDKIR